MSQGLYHGKVFMYPCAGGDIGAAVENYGSQFDTFLFVDINYQLGQFRVPAVEGWSEVADSATTYGSLHDSVRVEAHGKRKYRQIQPAWRRSRFQSAETGVSTEVVFRRGFGQYALHEVADGTLGMFLHRGDSSGEGGSNTHFLANRRMSHEPLSMLMDVIKRKLSLPALIASDGSNTRIRRLVDAARGDESIQSFNQHGLCWVRQGVLPGRLLNKTVVWQVTPASDDDRHSGPRITGIPS